MRVTTIDGGFRGQRTGLGTLPTATQSSESEVFLGSFDKFNRMTELLHQAVTHGSLPLGAAVELEATFVGLGAERNAHVARIATLANDADLAEWRSTGATITARANAAADRAGLLLGDTAGARPWQIAVALIGGAALFGGLAYVFARTK
jgi:hypothetical protein